MPMGDTRRASQRDRVSEGSHRSGDTIRQNQSNGNAPFTERDVIAVVKKNKNDEIRIAFTTYEEMNLVDCRVFTAFDGGEPRPTKKGVTVRIEKLPALVSALQDALAEAERRGLLSAESSS